MNYGNMKPEEIRAFGEVVGERPDDEDDALAESIKKSQSRWGTNPEGNLFWGTGNTEESIPPGLYKCGNRDDVGPCFQKILVETDELIQLPDLVCNEIISQIQMFWSDEVREKMEKRGFLHKRGILMFGEPGCHARDTEILMYDGTVKKVQDVGMGDFLMGPDSEPRTVLELCRGQEKMYRITPIKGESFVVNENHILSLRSTTKPLTKGTVVNMTVRDFIRQSETFKQRMKLYRTGVEFEESSLSLSPYILGVWLGDGTTSCAALTTADNEVRDEWCSWLHTVGCEVSISQKTSSKSLTYSGVVHESTKGLPRGTRTNPANNILDKIGVLHNKHIPYEYLTSSRQQRLELLAGLLDSDGHASYGYIDYITKSEKLANDVVFLARSLGFASYIKPTSKGCMYLGKKKIGKYWRVSIVGDYSIVPTKLQRKVSQPREQIKDPLATGFSIEEMPEDNYYGFILNRDHLYLTSDFTVHHNSGKTCTIQILVKMLIEKGGIAIHAEDPHILSNCLQLLRRIEPKRPLIVILEDFDTLTDRDRRENTWLAVLDGEAQVSNVVFLATSNYIQQLDKRIVDRPSRFDVIMPVPMPTAKARAAYIRYKEPELDNDTLFKWVQASEHYSIAHMKEMILSIICYGKSLEETVERLNGQRNREFSNATLEKEAKGSAGIGFQTVSPKGKFTDRETFDEFVEKELNDWNYEV